MIRERNNHPACTSPASLWNQALCVQGNSAGLNWNCTKSPDLSTRVELHWIIGLGMLWVTPSGPHWQHKELFPGCWKYPSLCPLPASVAFCPFHNQGWAFSLLFTISASFECWFLEEHLPKRPIIHHWAVIKIRASRRCSSRLRAVWFKPTQDFKLKTPAPCTFLSGHHNSTTTFVLLRDYTQVYINSLFMCHCSNKFIPSISLTSILLLWTLPKVCQLKN